MFPNVASRPDIDLKEVQRLVLDALDSYEYEVPAGALGRPHAEDWVARHLEEMRGALVEPEWQVVVQRDTPDGRPREVPEIRACVLVALDPSPDGYAELYYDPVEGEFVLASGDPPETFGVWGDAVGCFMAR
jgi:hypothetical protein